MTIDRLIRLPELKQIVGMSRSSIYAYVARSEFPAPVQVGARAVAWRQSDVETWVQARKPSRAA